MESIEAASMAERSAILKAGLTDERLAGHLGESSVETMAARKGDRMVAEWAYWKD